MGLVFSALTVFGILTLQDDIAKSAFNPEIPQLLPGAPGFSQKKVKNVPATKGLAIFWSTKRRQGGNEGAVTHSNRSCFSARCLLACLLLGCSYFASGVC